MSAGDLCGVESVCETVNLCVGNSVCRLGTSVQESQCVRPGPSLQESQLTELLDQLLEVEGGGDASLCLPERCAQPAASSLTEEDLTFSTDTAAADLLLQSVH